MFSQYIYIRATRGDLIMATQFPMLPVGPATHWSQHGSHGLAVLPVDHTVTLVVDSTVSYHLPMD